MAGSWRIEELMGLAAEALALAPTTGQSSGRVRDVPDVRTIRYYTTIGLIDRPAEMRGRTAFYAPRHLRQLVAIKRLQVQGLTLVEIQESLAGASAKKLDQLAGLPAGFIDATLASNSERNRKPGQDSTSAKGIETPAAIRNRAQFWSDVPDANAFDRANTPPQPEAILPRQMAVILPLDTGISLLLEGVAPEQLNERVVASLQPAVAVLREALVRAGLSHRSHDVDTGQFEQHRKHEENSK